MIRALILFKQIFRELLRTIQPRIYNPVKVSESRSRGHRVRGLAYVFMYVLRRPC